MGDMGRGDAEATPGPGSQVELPARRGDDVVRDELTVSFEVRYVEGAEGERVGAAQAKALAALLRWQAGRGDVDES
ncbi:hypothetical protein AB0H71_31770 [Nocardia sp. NPDC050697]|uniref:hypothetical protein n=1 Tax=Nocardia sp. NPDC050697 TaxID=3155158 RepID=UPI00340ED6BE